MRWFVIVVVVLACFGLYQGLQDSPQQKVKREACEASCAVFDECGFVLNDLSQSACEDQCMDQSTNAWSVCAIKHKLEYGCCAQALDYCSQHLE
ncbi:MAG: hypothetical protein CMI52_01555 [Parcubacteria group bacterium]|nr:hypothetical protein [Parcubacteria group bacterium]|tara:strand:- start:2060 stop:2341 length:282 start_codon:yes stop_codon:yes gene_type:complete